MHVWYHASSALESQVSRQVHSHLQLSPPMLARCEERTRRADPFPASERVRASRSPQQASLGGNSGRCLCAETPGGALRAALVPCLERVGEPGVQARTWSPAAVSADARLLWTTRTPDPFPGSERVRASLSPHLASLGGNGGRRLWPRLGYGGYPYFHYRT